MEHIRTAWVDNIIPSSWTQNIQITIEKKTRPQGINDYRIITLWWTGYKIYTSFLLSRLDQCIDSLCHYQAAFLQNRSTDDYIFTLRRVLDEQWKEETKTYVMAVDIKKAFDTINLNSSKDIFTPKTNKAFTNRMMKACTNESIYIKWYGQQTTMIQKERGVKQGC